MKRSAILVASALFVARAAAGAEPAHGPDARVRDLVYAADDAYRDGRYDEAADAFEEAYRVHPQAALLFNVAKCHEKSWLLRTREADLRAAVAAYRRYLAAVDRSSPKSRHGEAEIALERLTPAFDKLGAPAAAPLENPKSAPRTTRLMVGASVVGASARVDDAPAKPLPFLEHVSAGKHRVRVTCPEYLDEDREVVVAEGELTPIHAEMRPAPGDLVVRAPEGTAIYVDGRFAGRAPLPAALRVPAGDHDVALLDGGRVPWGRRVTVARASNAVVEGAPKRSTYRWAAYGLAGLAVLAGAGAGYEAGTALVRDLRVRRFLTRREQGEPLGERDLANYASDVAAHEEAQSRALTFAIVTSVLGLGAAGLYFIDKPTVADVVYEHEAPANTDPPRVSVTPVFTTTGASIDFTLRF